MAKFHGNHPAEKQRGVQFVVVTVESRWHTTKFQPTHSTKILLTMAQSRRASADSENLTRSGELLPLSFVPANLRCRILLGRRLASRHV